VACIWMLTILAARNAFDIKNLPDKCHARRPTRAADHHRQEDEQPDAQGSQGRAPPALTRIGRIRCTWHRRLPWTSRPTAVRQEASAAHTVSCHDLGMTGSVPESGNSSVLDHPVPGASAWERWSLWPWPALAVTVIAVAGALFGEIGALLVFSQTVATLLFVAGEQLLQKSMRPKIAVAAVVVGSLTVMLLLPRLHTGTRVAPVTGTPDLRGKRVTPAMLRNLSLRGALLDGARLPGLDLRGKNLAGASAAGASFAHARLDGVSMRGADLIGADFASACLRGADLAGAELDGADVAGADMTGVAIPRSVRMRLVGRPLSRGSPKSPCS
jgi:Pentapeptide repeats (8 copies)